MRIDTFKETILTIDKAANHLSKISGKKRNRSLVLRWANRGVAGVKLRTIQIGSEIFTSKEAINDFLNESRKAKQQKTSQLTSRGIKRTKLDELAKSIGI